MALQTTSLTAEAVYNPFTGLSERARANSAIPRAEVYATVNEGAWPAPGAGNTRRLRIIHTLDTNYAYVVVSCHLKARNNVSSFVYADTAAELAITASSKVYYSTALETYNGTFESTSGTPIGDIPTQNFVNLGDNEQIRLMELKQKQTGMIFPFNDTNSIPSVNLSWYEIVQNGSAYVIDYNLRLLQFDVDQAYNYLVNQPALTR